MKEKAAHSNENEEDIYNSTMAMISMKEAAALHLPDPEQCKRAIRRSRKRKSNGVSVFLETFNQAILKLFQTKFIFSMLYAY